MLEPNRNGYLDALRGMAILGVVAVHLSFPVSDLPNSLRRLLEHGQSGVQLFFVVSAFTLCQSVDRSGGVKSFKMAGFFLKRLFRIVPAYWLAIGAYFVMALCRPYPADLFARLGASFLFLNYLHPDWVVSILPPGGWSIVAEVFFYLLFPILYALIRTPLSAVVALIASTAVSFFFSHRAQLPTGADAGLPWNVIASATSFFGIVNQLPAFFCGFLAIRVTTKLFYGWAWSLGIVALIILSCLVKIVPDSLSLVYFGLLFAALTKALQEPWQLFVNRPLIVIGEVSFSIYLIHFAMIDLMAGLWPVPLSGVVQLCLFALTVFIPSMLMALVTYRWIERPFIALGRGLAHRVAAPERPDPE